MERNNLASEGEKKKFSLKAKKRLTQAGNYEILPLTKRKKGLAEQ